MIPATVSPAELRTALADLALRAAGFVRGRGMRPAREALLAALTNARQALSADDLPAAPAVGPQIRDAEELVCAYIAAGGDWHELVAALNRHAVDGATGRRHLPPREPDDDQPYRRAG